MAEAVEHSQMIATLSNMIQKCADPSISHMPVCKQELLDQYVGTMQNNYNILKHNHQRLYLVSYHIFTNVYVTIPHWARKASMCVHEVLCSKQTMSWQQMVDSGYLEDWDERLVTLYIIRRVTMS